MVKGVFKIKKRFLVIYGALIVVVIGISLFFYQNSDKGVAEAVLEEPVTGEELLGEDDLQFSQSRGTVRWYEEDLLARLVEAEAEAEPYIGKVAVAAVMINRVEDPAFPGTLSGVIYQPWAFESVMNGRIWRVYNFPESRKAAQAALNGWDPAYGALYFWNPATATSRWVWSRSVIVQYGKHVFAR